MMELSRKRIAVLGSTGSIGTQTLDIIGRHPDMFEAATLVAGSNVDALAEQCRRFHPRRAVIADRSLYARLKDAVASMGIEVEAGSEAVAYAMATDDVDMVVTATVGYSGLAPTISAINAGKEIALANKETLVVAGDLVARLLRRSGSRMIPVDSEHSAIYQCLAGERQESVSRLIITASGGPFRGRTRDQLRSITPAQALAHPTWNMGAKISIDSSTIMNKGLEVIEAHHLFAMPYDKIEVVVQPQSAIHSMVEFSDGSVKAHLGTTDMRIPIQFALSYPKRWEAPVAPLDFRTLGTLEFSAPDTKTFRCLALARQAGQVGGTLPCVMNAANEVAVEAFLSERLPYLGIAECVESVMEALGSQLVESLEQLSAIDHEARALAWQFVEQR